MPQDIHELIRDNDLVRRAYEFAREAHKGEKRKNGEAYFEHCVATAEQVAAWGMDTETIAAALLHDVPKYAAEKRGELSSAFGEEVGFLLARLSILRQVRYDGMHAKPEVLRKQLTYLAGDVRVLLVRLASRHHNLQSLYVFPAPEQKRIALETMDLYAPIAYSLGMHKLSGELDDLAFPYIYPQEHNWLFAAVKDLYSEREAYLKRLTPPLAHALEEHGVQPLRIEYRAKRYASLYRKLLRQQMDLSRIIDLVALRIIVRDMRDCYAALGVIHNLWMPIPGRIRDYIAAPKSNGYRSLHTVLKTPEGKVIEVQIRTEDMHREAELGIAAYLRYEATKGTRAYLEWQSVRTTREEMRWLEQLRRWQEQLHGSASRHKLFKIDGAEDRVFVLTPKGDVVELPKGATPVDFSYHIHTDLGNAFAGALVNGTAVARDYTLTTGDTVHILTHPGQGEVNWIDAAPRAGAREHEATSGELSKHRAPTAIRVLTEKQFGTLRHVSEVFDRHGIHIRSMEADPGEPPARLPSALYRFADASEETVTRVVADLEAVKGIKEVSVERHLV